MSCFWTNTWRSTYSSHDNYATVTHESNEHLFIYLYCEWRHLDLMTHDTSQSIIVCVAVFHPPYLVYDYLYHEPLEEGTCVQVPFGPMTKIGVVVSDTQKLSDSQNPYDPSKLKKLERTIHPSPLFSKQLLKLGYFLNSYYMHPLGDVLRTIQSYGTNSPNNWWVVLNPYSQKSPAISQLLKAIFKSRHRLREKTFLKNLSAQHHLLYESLAQSQELDSWQKSLMRLRNQQHIFKQYAPPGETSDLQKSADPNTVCPIIKDSQHRLLTLNDQQQNVFHTIHKYLLKGFHKPHLIHGITGSGKTQIYLHLISNLLIRCSQAQVLVMVPEISLTPQMTHVFSHVFGSLVAVVHSAMPARLRISTLESCRSHNVKILIGPRSAVFAPFSHLKLIIVDEEHDSSYKQSTGLCYHSRDTAIMRAKLEGATVVLGSATPSLESYHHAQTGKYILSTLSQRASGGDLAISRLTIQPPSTTIAQILPDRPKPAERFEQKSMIAHDIITTLTTNHQQGHQAMVIVQRRGYSPYVMDLKTHKVILCPDCSVSLTYHQHRKQLLCHYCDYSISLDDLRKQYPQARLVGVGQGTEKIYEDLKHKIPSARIARLDSDVPGLRRQMPEILRDFHQHKIDILVGTQMLAKGHDIANVTVSTLIEVDQMLRLPDFRAGEKTFQLIVQASGRAGRGSQRGQVLIQTSRPSHPIIQAALKQDYQRFYRYESKLRSQVGIPPYSRMIHCTYHHHKEDRIEQISQDLKQSIFHSQPPSDVKILGPSIPAISMMSNEHRRSITLISKNSKHLRDYTMRIKTWFLTYHNPIRLRIDVDPQSTM